MLVVETKRELDPESQKGLAWEEMRRGSGRLSEEHIVHGGGRTWKQKINLNGVSCRALKEQQMTASGNRLFKASVMVPLFGKSHVLAFL